MGRPRPRPHRRVPTSRDLTAAPDTDGWTPAGRPRAHTGVIPRRLLTPPPGRSSFITGSTSPRRDAPAPPMVSSGRAAPARRGIITKSIKRLMRLAENEVWNLKYSKTPFPAQSGRVPHKPKRRGPHGDTVSSLGPELGFDGHVRLTPPDVGSGERAAKGTAGHEPGDGAASGDDRAASPSTEPGSPRRRPDTRLPGSGSQHKSDSLLQTETPAESSGHLLRKR